MFTILQNFPNLMSAHLSETAKHWDGFLSHYRMFSDSRARRPTLERSTMMSLLHNDVMAPLRSTDPRLGRPIPLREDSAIGALSHHLFIA